MDIETSKHQEMWEAFVKAEHAYPRGLFSGRGIVICGGGMRYFTCAWVCVKSLRRFGCELPIQLWHLGEREMTDDMRSLLSPLGVECVDAWSVREKYPARILNGWEVKPYSIIHCPFEEVLLLDADNVPVVNPECLVGTPQYRQTGAIFWPDFGRLEPDRMIWQICQVGYRDEPEFETGQVLVNKRKCWKALQLTMYLNEYSDFYYRHIHGDKETFHMAFRKLNTPYSMPERGIDSLDGTMCQHDFDGRRIFQHRNLAKWNLFAPNRPIAGFLFEEQCRKHLEELRRLWDGDRRVIRRFSCSGKSDTIKRAADTLIACVFDYRRVGYDRRSMTFLPNGTIGMGAAGCEVFWDLKEENEQIVLEISAETELTCQLRRGEDDIWRGNWIEFERMPVELTPCPRQGRKP